MKGYRRLSIEEREEISRLLVLGFTLRGIGRCVNRSVSTISREVQGKRLGYRAVRAQRRALRKASKRKFGKRKLFKCHRLVKVIREKLEQYWSPQQIAKYLKSTYFNSSMHVSSETIYTYIYVLPRGVLRKELTDCLRRAHKKRKVRGRSQAGQTSNLEDMLSIEERPKEVADRTVPGHWEGDIIIGGQREQSAMGTLVERTTRSVILVPLKSKKAKDVRKAFAKEVKKLPSQMRLTLTYDQGREMAQHKLFTKQTKMKVYFAHPRSPWERGTNENTNGLLRQYFPKGTNFKTVSRKTIKQAQDSLNGRPRRTLNWKSPFEAMQELLR